MDRGQSFELLIRTKGWKYIKDFYQAKIQQFATSLLTSENKKIEEFESDRRELIGLRKLLGMIENDIEIARKQNEKSKGPA